MMCRAQRNQVFGPVVFVIAVMVVNGDDFPFATDDTLLFMEGETGGPVGIFRPIGIPLFGAKEAIGTGAGTGGVAGAGDFLATDGTVAHARCLARTKIKPGGPW